uniref:Uncharacterized protein n=1 Tax=Rhizophora mucronata TaxID=61149 RepID=A0A2P2NPP7_RHIMU
MQTVQISICRKIGYNLSKSMWNSVYCTLM